MNPSKFGAPIFVAAAQGNLSELESIKIAVGGNEFGRFCREYSASSGRKVLHVVAENGHRRICEFLMNDLKDTIDVPTCKGDTALILAVKGQHEEVAAYLIGEGASVLAFNSKGLTPLHYAVKKGNLRLMELMLQKDAALEADSVDGTPLVCAASLGNSVAMKTLLENGAEPNVISLVYGSPLICAIKSHSLKCMMELLLTTEDEAEADPDNLEAEMPPKKQRTAEDDTNNLEGGAQPKRRKADPNMFVLGLTPLAHAAREDDTRYLQLLIRAGANPNLPCRGLRPIEHAAMAQNHQGIQLLFQGTQWISHYPKWTGADDIMEHFHSGEAQAEREKARKSQLEQVDARLKSGEVHQDYVAALESYSKGAWLPLDRGITHLFDMFKDHNRLALQRMLFPYDQENIGTTLKVALFNQLGEDYLPPPVAPAQHHLPPPIPQEVVDRIRNLGGQEETFISEKYLKQSDNTKLRVKAGADQTRLQNFLREGERQQLLVAPGHIDNIHAYGLKGKMRLVRLTYSFSNGVHISRWNNILTDNNGDDAGRVWIYGFRFAAGYLAFLFTFDAKRQ